MRTRTVALLAVLVPALSAATPSPVFWGRDGHYISGRAATELMPETMPIFFRRASERLAYLNYEPDRWRSDAMTEMDDAFQYDHYVDLENLPEGALDARNRFDYLLALERAGLERPERDGGFLPFRIVEIYQRLESGFRRWRAAETTEERRWIEERIVNDAGILGHYVCDAAQPHHTTIHFNGWNRDTPNPEGYTTSSDIHWRFESAFVSAHVEYEEVRAAVGLTPRVVEDVRAAVLDQIVESNGHVERLYALERDVGFDPEGPRREATSHFATERLAAGATMLRDLWWTAWVRSEEPEEG